MDGIVIASIHSLSFASSSLRQLIKRKGSDDIWVQYKTEEKQKKDSLAMLLLLLFSLLQVTFLPSNLQQADCFLFCFQEKSSR